MRAVQTCHCILLTLLYYVTKWQSEIEAGDRKSRPYGVAIWTSLLRCISMRQLAPVAKLVIINTINNVLSNDSTISLTSRQVEERMLKCRHSQKWKNRTRMALTPARNELRS
jgi:hypothetical protein